MSKYAFGKKVNMGFDQAVTAVTQALAKEGFGVLTEIDVQATLKKKLGIERPPTASSAPATRNSPRARSRPSRRSARSCRATWWCARTPRARRSWSSWTPTPSSSWCSGRKSAESRPKCASGSSA